MRVCFFTTVQQAGTCASSKRGRAPTRLESTRDAQDALRVQRAGSREGRAGSRDGQIHDPRDLQHVSCHAQLVERIIPHVLLGKQTQPSTHEGWKLRGSGWTPRGSNGLEAVRVGLEAAMVRLEAAKVIIIAKGAVVPLASPTRKQVFWRTPSPRRSRKGTRG